mgnify:CR=1 FL=1
MLMNKTNQIDEVFVGSSNNAFLVGSIHKIQFFIYGPSLIMELFGCPDGWHNSVPSQNHNKTLPNGAANHVGTLYEV